MAGELTVACCWAGAGNDLTTAAVVTWQAPMTIAPPIRTWRRDRRSEKKRTKMPQATTLTAPKMAVTSRLLSPLPTISLKYCGPKYANAVAPVACWAVKTAKAARTRLKFSPCSSSTSLLVCL